MALFQNSTARPRVKSTQQQMHDQEALARKEARRQEMLMSRRKASEAARKSAVEKRQSLLTAQLRDRSQARPRGGTILTSRSPFGQGSLIGGSGTTNLKTIIGG